MAARWFQEKASKSLADLALPNSKENIRFARMYSEIIHSGKYTEQLIKLESSYKPAVDDMFKARDASLEELQAKGTKEIETAISQLGQQHTESTISCLSSQHCQDMERLLNNWNMSIDALKDAQREDFHEKLVSMYEDLSKQGNEGDVYQEEYGKNIVESRNTKPEAALKSDRRTQVANFQSKPSRFSGAKEKDNNHVSSDKSILSIEDLTLEASTPVQMEESFTINLGSQLKTAHNLRMLAAESLYLCDPKCNRSLQMRTQTAMSLYSHNLSALVLLVDNHYESYYGIQRDFANLCEGLNEFHFDDLSRQIKHIRDRVMPACAGRKYLELGDCYVTKHSNLANVHVVFHLVTDDSVKTSEVNSRHPIMASLRNILRVAHMYDIKTISIPLLLVDEMDEEILTVNWCLKRAELVLKCVKGFLIEMASLSTGVEQGTIQFLVPKGISEELFASLASLIPEIFRLSNSLVLKSSVGVV